MKQVAPVGELAGKELLATQRRYFVELRVSIQKAIDAGKTLDQIKDEHDLPFYLEWTGVEAKSRTENVEHVYRELTAGRKPLNENDDFNAWRQLPGAGQYARIETWDQPGTCELDRRLSRLADIYLAGDTSLRKQIRDYFGGRENELDEMWIYVRRMGALIKSANDVALVRRGLAIAAIEGGRQDYRDTIVSLVLLRHGAERSGIDVNPLFLEIQREEFIAPENKGYFENARTHAPSDIAATVRAFGSVAWKNDLQRKNSQKKD